MTESESKLRQRTEGRRDRSRDPAILKAALSVLTEHRYYATSMNYIAARAGVGKAAIYRRWASKAALIPDALVYWRPDLLSNALQHRRLARRPRFPCRTSQTQRQRPGYQ
jgi:AcrR family transcriptional regulator